MPAPTYSRAARATTRSRAAPGADTLTGGSGTDTANYWTSASGVTVNLTTNVNTGGDAASDSLSGIENVIGSDYADTLTGDAGDNVLAGEGGRRRHRRRGRDRHRRLFDSSMAAGVGIITIDLSTGTATGGDAEGDTLSNIENITASANMDMLIGDAGDNILRGLGDHDDLDGGSGGFDILMGGEGDDNMYGGGILTADYSDATSAVTVDISINGSQDTIGAGVIGMWGISHLTGSAYADTLTGTENDNVIRGGGGADTIAGGDGIDTASYSTSASAVTVNLATNVNTGGDAQGDSLTAMENLTGSDYNDTLTGNTGINVLSGGAGNDALSGGDGNDTLIGGSGGDTLIGGDGDDVLLAGEDIVKDGLFSQEPMGGDNWHHKDIGTVMGGWTVVSGSVDIINSTYYATDHGGYSVGMDSTSPGSIKQTLTTVVGHSYTVTFDLGGDFLGGDIIKTLQVSAGASSQIYTVEEQVGWSQSDIGFTYQSFTFTATGSSTDLLFASLQIPAARSMARWSPTFTSRTPPATAVTISKAARATIFWSAPPVATPSSAELELTPSTAGSVPTTWPTIRTRQPASPSTSPMPARRAAATPPATFSPISRASLDRTTTIRSPETPAIITSRAGPAMTPSPAAPATTPSSAEPGPTPSTAGLTPIQSTIPPRQPPSPSTLPMPVRRAAATPPATFCLISRPSLDRATTIPSPATPATITSMAVPATTHSPAATAPTASSITWVTATTP